MAEILKNISDNVNAIIVVLLLWVGATVYSSAKDIAVLRSEFQNMRNTLDNVMVRMNEYEAKSQRIEVLNSKVLLIEKRVDRIENKLDDMDR